MTKQELHNNFQQVIHGLTCQTDLQAKNQSICNMAIQKLRQFDVSIFEDLPRDSRLKMYTSFSGFFTKEFNAEMPHLAKAVSQPVFEYAKLFDLVDPGIAKLLGG